MLGFSQNAGDLFGGPYDKNYGSRGPYWDPPMLGNCYIGFHRGLCF